jgi:acetoin utilization protein AcuC
LGFGAKANIEGDYQKDRGAFAVIGADAGPADPIFIGSGIYRGSTYGMAHPLRVPRVSTVMDLARVLGWLPPERFRLSPRAKPAALTAWHDPAYIAALQLAERTGSVSDEVRRCYGLGTLSNPVFAEMYRRPATGAGGVMLAGELLARRPGVVYVPGGGTHHGMPAYANGFCYLNDPVLGILTLRRAGIQRVAYIDIDAHHPDGVEHAFAGDPDVLMISVHEQARWPFTGQLGDAGCGNCFNLPVPPGFNDTEMRAVLQRLILPRVTAFAPEAVVLQCGADALLEDPLSRLALSNNAHWAVVAALRDVAPRYLVLGGGGYNPWSVGRCWAGVWATLVGYAIPDALPDDAEAVLRALSWGGGGRPAASEAMLTTLRDPPREGPVRAEVTDRITVLSAR